jgi:uncharacterized membrane protein YcaP (DUF421 family)
MARRNRKIANMNTLSHFAEMWLGLGLEPKDLTFVQISLRGVIVINAALLMIRLGSKRSLAEKTVFDAVLIVTLASVLARTVNGGAPFFPTIGCGFVLVFLHRLFAWIACRSHLFGILIKGEPHVIVQDGKIHRDTMRRNQISKHDLEEDLRLNAHTEELAQIRVARIERSGDISFIKNGA